MKTKQLSFEFPYRSNADGVVKLKQFLKQNLLEIDKAYDDDYKWELQKLKRDRDDKDYRIGIIHKMKHTEHLKSIIFKHVGSTFITVYFKTLSEHHSNTLIHIITIDNDLLVN